MLPSNRETPLTAVRAAVIAAASCDGVATQVEYNMIEVEWWQTAEVCDKPKDHFGINVVYYELRTCISP